jgi:hypothetical protein
MVPQQYFLGHDQYLLEVEDPNCRLWRKKYREREREGEREREREAFRLRERERERELFELGGKF